MCVFCIAGGNIVFSGYLDSQFKTRNAFIKQIIFNNYEINIFNDYSQEDHGESLKYQSVGDGYIQISGGMITVFLTSLLHCRHCRPLVHRCLQHHCLLVVLFKPLFILCACLCEWAHV